MDGSPPLHECLQQIILFDLTLPDLILIPGEDGTPHFLISSVLRPGPARWVDLRPGRPATRSTQACGWAGSKQKTGWELARPDPAETRVYFFLYSHARNDVVLAFYN
jgi:hypothetical protein